MILNCPYSIIKIVWMHHSEQEEQAGTTQTLKGTSPQKLCFSITLHQSKPPLAHQYMSLHHSEQEEQTGTTPTQKV